MKNAQQQLLMLLQADHFLSIDLLARLPTKPTEHEWYWRVGERAIHSISLWLDHRSLLMLFWINFMAIIRLLLIICALDLKVLACESNRISHAIGKKCDAIKIDFRSIHWLQHLRGFCFAILTEHQEKWYILDAKKWNWRISANRNNSRLKRRIFAERANWCGIPKIAVSIRISTQKIHIYQLFHTVIKGGFDNVKYRPIGHKPHKLFVSLSEKCHSDCAPSPSTKRGAHK